MDNFQAIHDEFRPRVHRFLCRMVGTAEAEDLTQEVLLKASQALNGFRGDSSISTWLYRIATNTALDYLRSAPSRQKTMQESLAEASSGQTDNTETPEDGLFHLPDMQLIRKDMNDCIRELIHGLPEHYRTVLVLSDLQELTNAEIAEILNVSLATVKIRLHRARAMLRQVMEERCLFYRDGRNELACDRKPPAG